MNLLLFDEKELKNNRLNLPGNDRRAKHIIDILHLKQGDNLRVGMIGGEIGSGRIVSVAKDLVELDISLSETLANSRDMTLILALPRPIMLQRILKQATVMGIKQFHLIRSAQVQKSYFQSTVLEKDNIRNLLIQGLEQAMGTRLPKVTVHKRFRPFVEDIVPSMKEDVRLLAHPDVSCTLPDLYEQGKLNGEFVLAVGPEGGWNEFEVNSLRDQGFEEFSFGPRILHVDTAVLVLLSQLMLLQDLRNR